MEFTFLLLHNFPVMILARDEERPIKINKREAAWALIPLSSEYFTYKNNQTSQYIIGQSVQNTSCMEGARLRYSIYLRVVDVSEIEQGSKVTNMACYVHGK